MKRVNLFLIAFMLLISTSAKSQYFIVDTLKLNNAYTNLMSNTNSIKHQKDFFDAFPNSWQEFINTYQYVSSKGYNLSMYYKAHEHIGALEEKLTQIDSQTYCNKIVNIAIGATHEADAPSYYQSMLHNVMKSKSDYILKAISKLRKGYQMQFWQFYWSNGVESKPLEKEYEDFLKSNIDSYPDEMKIMKIAFEYFYNGVNIDGGYLEE